MRKDDFIPTPSAASGPAFLLTEARRAGLSEYACRPPRMHSPTSSVRSLTPVGSARDYAAAFALALPDDVAFSHVTAARIWGLPLPAVLAPDHRVHVMRYTNFPRIERHSC